MTIKNVVAVNHPLEPLTGEEVEQAVSILKVEKQIRRYCPLCYCGFT